MPSRQRHPRGEIARERLHVILRARIGDVRADARRHQQALADPGALERERNLPRQPAAGQVQHQRRHDDHEQQPGKQAQELRGHALARHVDAFGQARVLVGHGAREGISAVP